MSSVPACSQYADHDINARGNRTEIGEDGVDEGAPESVESSCGTRVYVFLESTGVFVVLEPGSIIGACSNSKEERQEDYANLAHS